MWISMVQISRFKFPTTILSKKISKKKYIYYQKKIPHYYLIMKKKGKINKEESNFIQELANVHKLFIKIILAEDVM